MRSLATTTRFLALCLLVWTQLWAPLLHAHIHGNRLGPWHLSFLVHDGQKSPRPPIENRAGHGLSDQTSLELSSDTAVVGTNVMSPRATTDEGARDAPPLPYVWNLISILIREEPRACFRPSDDCEPSQQIASLLPPAQGPPSRS